MTYIDFFIICIINIILIHRNIFNCAYLRYIFTAVAEGIYRFAAVSRKYRAFFFNDSVFFWDIIDLVFGKIKAVDWCVGEFNNLFCFYIKREEKGVACSSPFLNKLLVIEFNRVLVLRDRQKIQLSVIIMKKRRGAVVSGCLGVP